MIYLFGNEYSEDIDSRTMQELETTGDVLDFVYKDGILIRIDETSVRNQSIQFDVQKWRNSTGAVGFQGCEAEWEQNTWDYRMGAGWIS